MLKNNPKAILDHFFEITILSKGFADLFRFWLNHNTIRRMDDIPLAPVGPAQKETDRERALSLRKKLMRGYCCSYDPCTSYAGYGGIHYYNGEPVSSLPPQADAFAAHL